LGVPHMRKVVIVCIVVVIIALWLARAALAVPRTEPIAVEPALEGPRAVASRQATRSPGFPPISTQLRSISPSASRAYSVPG